MLRSDIPEGLSEGPVCLRFSKIVSAEPGGGLVPFYHFTIETRDEEAVGHINLRVGQTSHVRMCAGHIGYEILPEYQGHSFSYHACRALAPFIGKLYDHVVLTVDPSNAPSICIIERLGARFMEEIEVPADDPAYAGGARCKRRYEWRIIESQEDTIDPGLVRHCGCLAR